MLWPTIKVFVEQFCWSEWEVTLMRGLKVKSSFCEQTNTKIKLPKEVWDSSQSPKNIRILVRFGKVRKVSHKINVLCRDLKQMEPQKKEGYFNFIIMRSLTTHDEEEIFIVSYFFPHFTGQSSWIWICFTLHLNENKMMMIM